MADVERTRRILAIELLLKRIMTLQHEQDVARETIGRLMENSKALSKSLESEYYDCDNEPCDLAYYRALLAELEGKG